MEFPLPGGVVCVDVCPLREVAIDVGGFCCCAPGGSEIG